MKKKPYLCFPIGKKYKFGFSGHTSAKVQDFHESEGHLQRFSRLQNKEKMKCNSSLRIFRRQLVDYNVMRCYNGGNKKRKRETPHEF